MVLFFLDRIQVLRSDRGLTLIEVLAVTVVMGILLSAMSSMTVFLMRSSGSSNLLMEESQLMTRLAVTIGNSQACTENFKNSFAQMAASTDASSRFHPKDSLLKTPMGQVFIQKLNPVSGVPGLKVTDIYVTGLVKVLHDAPIPGDSAQNVRGDVFEGKLSIEFNRGPNFLGKSDSVRAAPFFLRMPTSPAGTPASCTLGTETLTTETLKRLIKEQTAEVCSQMGGELVGSSCNLKTDWNSLCKGMNTTANQQGTGCTPPSPPPPLPPPPSGSVRLVLSNPRQAVPCPAGFVFATCLDSQPYTPTQTRNRGTMGESTVPIGPTTNVPLPETQCERKICVVSGT